MRCRKKETRARAAPHSLRLHSGPPRPPTAENPNFLLRPSSASPNLKAHPSSVSAHPSRDHPTPRGRDGEPADATDKGGDPHVPRALSFGFPVHSPPRPSGRIAGPHAARGRRPSGECREARSQETSAPPPRHGGWAGRGGQGAHKCVPRPREAPCQRGRAGERSRGAGRDPS